MELAMTFKQAIQENRVAEFAIMARLLQDPDADVVHRLLSQVLVVRCERLHNPPCLLYTAFSPLFEQVPDFTMAPRVGLHVHLEQRPVPGAELPGQEEVVLARLEFAKPGVHDQTFVTKIKP